MKGSGEMATHFDLEGFGKLLQALREASEMTRFDLAAEAEIDLGTLEAMEKGDVSPDLRQVSALAGALNVSPDYLLGLTHHRERDTEGESPDTPGEIKALEIVLSNETGWHTRGMAPPSESEKALLRRSLRFRGAQPRELVQFYWDIVPGILIKIRAGGPFSWSGNS